MSPGLKHQSERLEATEADNRELHHWCQGSRATLGGRLTVFCNSGLDNKGLQGKFVSKSVAPARKTVERFGNQPSNIYLKAVGLATCGFIVKINPAITAKTALGCMSTV